MFAIAASTVTSWGLYVLLPIFIAFLFFIMWDISKESDAGRAGTFWIFLALGAGFVGFILKLLLEVAFKKWLI
jgi:FtsH-binding integral membrane protein